MKVGRSKTNLPTITESGGGRTNTGYSTIICGKEGERIKPIFVPRGYCNSEHAIFVARIGMHIIEASHDRNGETAFVSRIEKIGNDECPDELIVKDLYSSINGDGNIPEKFENAVDAAIEKANCYHCREPHYIIKWK